LESFESSSQPIEETKIQEESKTHQEIGPEKILEILEEVKDEK